MRGAIAPGVSKPVYTFPVPIVRPRIEAVDRAEFEIPGGRFAFIFSFNFWSIFERKNPLGLGSEGVLAGVLAPRRRPGHSL